MPLSTHQNNINNNSVPYCSIEVPYPALLEGFEKKKQVYDRTVKTDQTDKELIPRT